MYAIHDPLGQTNSPASIDNYSHFKVALWDFDKWGRTIVCTDTIGKNNYHYVQAVIVGRPCGSI